MSLSSTAMSEAIVRGQQGKEVEHLQRLLAHAGQRMVIDGVYGPRTQAAVASFLRSRALPGTGARVDAALLELLEQAAGCTERVGTTAAAPVDTSRVYMSSSWTFIPTLTADERNTIDCLGVRSEARAFARLICSRRTGTPLSVGLFGDWGSGKSFFMNRLQADVETRCAAFTRVATRLQAQNDEAGLCALQERWHGRVAQITFNAWHFAEPNLWASLITRVFDELAAIVSPAEPVEDTRARLLAEVSEGKQRREQARLDLRKAEAQLAEARVERERRETEIKQVREELAVVKALGPTGAPATAPEGEATPVPRLTVRGPIAALRVTLRWVWSRGRWSRIAFVAALVLIVLGILLAIAWWRGWWRSWLDPSIAMATSAVGVGTGVVGTASAWWTVIQPRIDQTRAAHAVYVTQRATAGGLLDRALRDLMSPSEGALGVARQRMEEAQVGLDSAKLATDQASEKVARARHALQEIEGGQRFYAFVKDRDEGDDYRRHLGLVSLVRDDFARLEQILEQVEREGPGDGEVAPLSRIVLYVDDLDRCEPARVVEVLQAVTLLLSTPIFVVVVAANVRWLQRSLALHLDRLLQRAGPGAVKAAEAAADDADPTPRSYLEKIFQIPFSLRPIDADGFASLVNQVITRPGVPIEEARAASERIAEIRRTAADESITAPAKAEAPKPETPANPEASTRLGRPSSADPSVVRPVDLEARRVQAELDADLAQDVSLALDPAEVAFLQRLHVVVGAPRLAKALVNTYRLLRAEIEAGILPSYVADGTCRGVLTLLAIQIGRPRDAARLFDALHRTKRATLGEVLLDLAGEAGSDRREAGWHALATAVQEAGTAGARASELATWTVRIRRFSFDPWPSP
jgi:hypothetical protein